MTDKKYRRLRKANKTAMTTSVPIYVKDYIEELAVRYGQTTSAIVTAAMALFHAAHIQMDDRQAREVLATGQSLAAMGLFKIPKEGGEDENGMQKDV